ncbi:MAG: tRNA (guanosine(46)-N7)-methyltransferase TrmB [Legionellales bacterium]|nr:tRNA (guanosine(46)-N7)-methyltransferase TrmB [Legionellales bacterium]
MDTFYRTVRSFVRRNGRLTPSQDHALTHSFAEYGLTITDHPLDFTSIFKRQAPLILEIGFGNGETLASMAQNMPEHDFIGIEVHRPGVGNLIKLIQHHQLTNIRIFCDDAVEVLKQAIADNSLDAIHIFFPDPWHKKRHHKRRLINENFIQLITPKLKIGGTLHLATDWEDYALQMMAVLSRQTTFSNLAGLNQFAPRPASRPLTKFERRGQKLGHGVWDLLFCRR